MSGFSAGMTRSGTFFAVPNTRSGGSASPSRRGSAAASASSFRLGESGGVYIMHDDASRHLEGQKWEAGAGDEDDSIAGGESRVEGAGDATNDGEGDLGGGTSMMMLHLSELDETGDPLGDLATSHNVSQSVIESTPTDILRASRNSIHDAFRMLDALQAQVRNMTWTAPRQKLAASKNGSKSFNESKSLHLWSFHSWKQDSLVCLAGAALPTFLRFGTR